MFAPGQTEKNSARANVFRVTPEADIAQCNRHVSKVPTTEMGGLYSITSSARVSTVAGISTPSVFAVLRFTTSSNLVGCSTGRSDGFAPLRILSTYVTERRPK